MCMEQNVSYTQDFSLLLTRDMFWSLIFFSCLPGHANLQLNLEYLDVF